MHTNQCSVPVVTLCLQTRLYPIHSHHPSTPIIRCLLEDLRATVVAERNVSRTDQHPENLAYHPVQIPLVSPDPRPAQMETVIEGRSLVRRRA